MFKLQFLFERQAKAQMTLHPTAKEYGPILMLSTIGKVATMAISIAGGVLYFAGLFAGLYLPLVVVLSVTLLMLLEGFNMYALFLALKMGLRGRPQAAVILALLSLVLFAGSFYLTTEGVHQWKAAQTTQSTAIATDYKAQRDSIAQRYAHRVQSLEKAAAPLAEYAWKSTQVAHYQRQIDSLHSAQRSELQQLAATEAVAQANDTKRTDQTAHSYWLLGVVLMVAQLAFNVVIAVLYNRIYGETQQVQKIDEELKTLRESRLNRFYGQIRSDFAALENMYLQRLTLSGPLFDALPEVAPTYAVPVATTQRTESRIGFAQTRPQGHAQNRPQNTPESTPESTRENAQKTHAKNAEPSTRVGTPEVLACTQDELKVPPTFDHKAIKFLEKHKAVTRAICNVVPTEADGITNAQINQVKRLARGAKHKSDTLIRSVFIAAQSVGFEAVKQAF